MATKQFYATGDFRYGTRMLRAGDPVEMDAPSARLFGALGKISLNSPSAAKKAPAAKTLEDLTKAELAKKAGFSPSEAKKVTKQQLIDLLSK